MCWQILKSTTLHYSLSSLLFCLAHRHPFSLAETFDNPNCFFSSILFEHRRKVNWKSSGGGRRERKTATLQMSKSINKQVEWQLVWQSLLKCMHTVSVTITSNKLQSFSFIWTNAEHGRGFGFGAQPGWQRYMRKNKVLGSILCWRCRKFGSSTLFV